MENYKINIILSERGKELANVGAFKYKFIGPRKKGELLKLQCTKNNCTAMIYFGPEKNKVIRLSEQHNYIENSPSKIE